MQISRVPLRQKPRRTLHLCGYDETPGINDVTQKNRCTITVSGVDRFHPSPDIGLIEKIVMDQSSSVNQLDHRRTADVIGADLTETAAREEHTCRSNLLAPEVGEVFEQFMNVGFGGFELSNEVFAQLLHVPGNGSIEVPKYLRSSDRALFRSESLCVHRTGPPMAGRSSMGSTATRMPC